MLEFSLTLKLENEYEEALCESIREIEKQFKKAETGKKKAKVKKIIQWKRRK